MLVTARLRRSYSAYVLLILLLIDQVLAEDGLQDLLAPASKISKQPNIIFILTDDQDLRMDSLDYMPLLRKHMIDEGTFYQRHFCTIALCCPSRVSLWTGKAAHNTNVTDVNPPYGGYPKFVSQGLNEAYLPVWLQDAGYKTYYTGKLFNSHTVDNYNDPYPAGFTASDFLLDPYTYDYLNATFQRNKSPPKSYEGQYSTDVVASKAYAFLDNAVTSQDPFFLAVAPIACHSRMGEDILAPPVPAERHKDLFSDVIVPRHANFNPEKPSSVNWISTLPRQNAANIEFNDHFYRNRLRTLQAVDEMVDELIARLEKHGVLEDTFIIYTSDNGYHIGQHRLQPGKECGFEEDINVPLIVRGPRVPKGQVSDIVTTHTDLAPTILGLIGEKPRPEFDGIAIPVTKTGLEYDKQNRHEHVTVEYWGFALSEGNFGQRNFWNNTYKALRMIGEDYNLYYSVWCNNEHEFYDMINDPYQTHNIYPNTFSPSPSRTHQLQFGDQSYAISRILSRLDSLLLVLKSCKAGACIRPWSVLHPEGNVHNLHDALDPTYDHFYQEEQRRVAFTRCEQGYIVDAEGPQEALSYEKLLTRGRNKIWWSEFV